MKERFCCEKFEYDGLIMNMMIFYLVPELLKFVVIIAEFHYKCSSELQSQLASIDCTTFPDSEDPNVCVGAPGMYLYLVGQWFISSSILLFKKRQLSYYWN